VIVVSDYNRPCSQTSIWKIRYTREGRLLEVKRPIHRQSGLYRILPVMHTKRNDVSRIPVMSGVHTLKGGKSAPGSQGSVIEWEIMTGG